VHKQKRKMKMKKMMIAACVIALAAVTQAASVTWGAGKTLPALTIGESAATLPGYVQMVVFENSTAYDMSKIYSDYAAGTIAGTKVGTAEWTALSGILGTTGVSGGTTWKEGDSVYGAVLFLYSSKKDFSEGVEYYIANTAKGVATDAGSDVSNLGSVIGGLGSGGGATSWQAVPEPTSGLLMLVGLAGLALRRKRA
jgi:hypothetical protein